MNTTATTTTATTTTRTEVIVTPFRTFPTGYFSFATLLFL
jgi:hypothetical protein